MLEQMRENLLKKVQKHVDALGVGGLKGKISDGYHTFDELYEFRKMFNVALFNAWANPNTVYFRLNPDAGTIDGVESYKGPLYDVHKSVRHHDGQVIFGGNFFIVVAVLPTGQISNHYGMEDWDLFKIPIENKAKYEFDGHTGADVLERLKSL